MEELRGELEENQDQSVVQREMQKKREDDFAELKNQIETEAKEHDAQMVALRQKHHQLAEDLNAQLETFKRGKAALG